MNPLGTIAVCLSQCLPRECMTISPLKSSLMSTVIFKAIAQRMRRVHICTQKSFSYVASWGNLYICSCKSFVRWGRSLATAYQTDKPLERDDDNWHAAACQPLRAPECEQRVCGPRKGMKNFWSGGETRRSGQAPFPGKGRRFKSCRPHQLWHAFSGVYACVKGNYLSDRVLCALRGLFSSHNKINRFIFNSH